MKIALYCRSSIKSQENSINMQRTVSEAVAAQHSLLIDEEYIDTSVSARLNEMEDRPNLIRLLNDIKRGSVDTLIVYKRDRLARNIVQHLKIYEILKKYNVKVIFSASNELPLQYSPAGEFFELVIAGFNEREVNQIALRIRDTKQALFFDGKNHGSKLPYGYYIDKDRRIQLDVEKTEKIREIFNELLETDCGTLSDFVRLLESKGTLEVNKNNYSKIKKRISTYEYKGVRRAKFLEEFVEIDQKRLKIIDEHKWDQAQEKLKSLIRSSGKQKKEVAMLDDLVFCMTCNEPVKRKLISMAGKESVMYYCSSHYRNKVSQTDLEALVLEEVTKWVDKIANSNSNRLFLENVINKVIKENTAKLSEIEKEMKIVNDKLICYSELWIQDKNPSTQEEMMSEYSKLIQFENKKILHINTQNFMRAYPERIQAIWEQLNACSELQKMNNKQIVEMIHDVLAKIEIGIDLEVKLIFKNPFIEIINYNKDGELTIALNLFD